MVDDSAESDGDDEEEEEDVERVRLLLAFPFSGPFWLEVSRSALPREQVLARGCKAWGPVSARTKPASHNCSNGKAVPHAREYMQHFSRRCKAQHERTARLLLPLGLASCAIMPRRRAGSREAAALRADGGRGGRAAPVPGQRDLPRARPPGAHARAGRRGAARLPRPRSISPSIRGRGTSTKAKCAVPNAVLCAA